VFTHALRARLRFFLLNLILPKGPGKAKRLLGQQERTAEARVSGEGVFAKSAPRTAINEAYACAMLTNGLTSTAHYWPHTEWPQAPPRKLLYGWRKPRMLAQRSAFLTGCASRERQSGTPLSHQRECRGAWRCALLTGGNPMRRETNKVSCLLSAFSPSAVQSHGNSSVGRITTAAYAGIRQHSGVSSCGVPEPP
jgi:hypothetical protein